VEFGAGVGHLHTYGLWTREILFIRNNNNHDDDAKLRDCKGQI
jgi:hypothetical protein